MDIKNLSKNLPSGAHVPDGWQLANGCCYGGLHVAPVTSDDYWNLLHPEKQPKIFHPSDHICCVSIWSAHDGPGVQLDLDTKDPSDKRWAPYVGELANTLDQLWWKECNYREPGQVCQPEETYQQTKWKLGLDPLNYKWLDSTDESCYVWIWGKPETWVQGTVKVRLVVSSNGTIKTQLIESNLNDVRTDNWLKSVDSLSQSPACKFPETLHADQLTMTATFWCLRPVGPLMHNTHEVGALN